MKTKTNALMLVVASIIACLVLVAPFAQANQSSTISLGDDLTEMEIEETNTNRWWIRPKARFAAWFLQNSEPVQVQGTIVALSDNKLVSNTATDQIRVHLPAEWTVNNEVLTREELMASGYMCAGETITIKTLQAEVTNKEGLRIYITAAYELTNQAGQTAIANIIINIED
ncbi:MAG: hypothetical protein IAX21_04375 [Candidatus Bathyarchaeota archaeon]|nr:MAG: hypothetical protein IAX21_04375 [Candidatus Bathyarchaeota archaeon]